MQETTEINMSFLIHCSCKSGRRQKLQPMCGVRTSENFRLKCRKLKLKCSYRISPILFAMAGI